MRVTGEQIRQTLAKRDGISEEVMRPLAAAYAAEVTRVNDRLAAAVALLHKGLRSEAIQSASIMPNAIDDAAKLDLPDNEQEDWHDILQFLDVAVPPVLNRDHVDQLNEAIVDTQPLESLMKRHRLLAIARAPLAWRLKVLRRIAEVDSGNPVWEEDLDAWETVRHKQIATEAPAVVSSADPVALRMLHDELTGSPWRVAPDAKIVRQVKTTLSHLAENETLQQLEQIAPTINDSFCEFDEPSARQRLAQWDSLVDQLVSPLPDHLNDQVDPARIWLAEVDREIKTRQQRAVAIGQLESALDQKASIEDLEKAYQQSALFDEPPPEELVQRYWVSVEERKLSQKRRFQTIVAAIVAAAAVLMGAFGWWQVNAAYNSTVAAVETEFQALLDAGNLDSANKFYQSLQEVDPAIANTATVRSIAGQLQTQVEAETERATQFDRYLAEADSEDDANIDVSALNRAEALAKTDIEKGRAYTLRRRHSQWEGSVVTGQTEKLLGKLKLVRDRLADIEAGDPDQAAMLQLNAMLDEVKTMEGESPRADFSARSQIASTRTRIISIKNAIYKRDERIRAEDAAMKNILSAKSLDAYAAALKSFAAESPDSPMADEFGRAADERPIWDKGLAWNNYVVAVARGLSTPLSAENAKAVLDAATAMESQIDQSPLKLPSGTTERFSRYDERAKILQRVLGDLPETVIADLYTIVGSGGSGDRYFIYKTYFDRVKKSFELAPAGAEKIMGVEVVTDDSGAVKPQGISGNFQIDKEPYQVVQKLVVDFQTRHDEILADWDGEFLKLIAELRGRPNLDGKIKEMLLQHLLSGACEGSDYLSENLVRELRLLKERSEEVMTWYEAAKPNDKMADRIEAEIMSRLGQLYKSRPQPESELAKLKQLQFEQVGLLVRRSGGEIAVKLTSPLADCRLAVVRGSDREQEKVDWVQIGVVQEGRASLSGGAEDLVAGRPVFSFPK